MFTNALDTLSKCLEKLQKPIAELQFRIHIRCSEF